MMAALVFVQALPGNAPRWKTTGKFITTCSHLEHVLLLTFHRDGREIGQVTHRFLPRQYDTDRIVNFQFGVFEHYRYVGIVFARLKVSLVPDVWTSKPMTRVFDGPLRVESAGASPVQALPKKGPGAFAANGGPAAPDLPKSPALTATRRPQHMATSRDPKARPVPPLGSQGLSSCASFDALGASGRGFLAPPAPLSATCAKTLEAILCTLTKVDGINVCNVDRGAYGSCKSESTRECLRYLKVAKPNSFMN